MNKILEVASSERRVLVTHDLRSIPALLKEWAESGQHHGGVVLIDEKTLRPSDISGVLHALRQILRAHGDDPWLDRVVFLRAQGSTET